MRIVLGHYDENGMKHFDYRGQGALCEKGTVHCDDNWHEAL